MSKYFKKSNCLTPSDVFVDNGDGTFTHTDANGNPVTYTSTQVVGNGDGTYTVTNADGSTVTITGGSTSTGNTSVFSATTNGDITTISHEAGDGSAAVTTDFCNKGIMQIEDEDGRVTEKDQCQVLNLHRSLHVDYNHINSDAPVNPFLIVSNMDSSQISTDIDAITTRHNRTALNVDNALVSGIWSMASSGEDLTVTATRSAIVGGTANQSTLARDNFMGGGRLSSIINSDYSVALGGTGLEIISTNRAFARNGLMGGTRSDVIDSSQSGGMLNEDLLIENSIRAAGINSSDVYIKGVNATTIASTNTRIDVYDEGASVGDRTLNTMIAAVNGAAELRARESAIIAGSGASIIHGDSTVARSGVIIGSFGGEIKSSTYAMIQGSPGAVIDGSKVGAAEVFQDRRAIMSSGNNNAASGSSKIFRGNTSMILGGGAIDGIGLTIDIRNNPAAPYLATEDSLWDYGSIILGGTNGKQYGQQSVLIGGRDLQSNSACQVVMGKKNIRQGTSRTEDGGSVWDSNDHVLIIGNGGTPGAQALDNALTVNWYGRVEMFDNTAVPAPVDTTKGALYWQGGELFAQRPGGGTPVQLT